MHSSITLDALRALDAIDKTGSFAAAAKHLYKVPSALTYTIKKLEEELAVPLFDRSKQRAVLTPAGQLVLEQGREILLATNRMFDSVKQLESGWELEIKIARDTVVPFTPLFNLVNEFNQLKQDVDISLSEEVLAGGWDALQNKRADIAIGVSGELPKGLFNLHKMGSIRFSFMVAAKHPLAQIKHTLDADDLQAFPAIVVADTAQILPGRSSGLFDSKQVIRVHNMATKVAAQAQGIGVGFLPLHLAKPYLSTGELVEKTCSIPRPDIDLYLAWNKGQQGNALNWFIEQLKSVDWQF